MEKPIDFIFVSNTSWYIWNFRINLIKELLKNNHSILVIAPEDDYSNRIIQAGCKFISWDLDRSSINPISEIKSIINIYKIYKRFNPSIIHQFTIKSCLYGSLAARFLNDSHVFNSITGLGHLFISKRIKNKILKFFILPIYKYAINYKNSSIIFQNRNDLDLYKSLNLIKQNRTKIIRGSGVNTKYFAPTSKSGSLKKIPIILFSGRIIKEKGIIELLKACSRLWSKGIDFNLNIVGEFDTGNRSFIIKDKLEDYINKKEKVHFLGHINDIKSVYSEADIVVLPSWREGLSRTLLEASAMELPIITTNVPGCNDIIEHGVNGLLVPPKDTDSLSLAIEFILKNKIFAKSLGKNARKKVIENFDENIINKQTIDLYKEI